MRSSKPLYGLMVVGLACALGAGVHAQQTGATVVALGAAGGGARFHFDQRLAHGDGALVAQPEAFTSADAAKYLFNTPADKWLPYVGLGAAYASFDKVWLDPAHTQALALVRRLSPLSASGETVYSVGLIYRATPRWSVQALVAYVPLRAGAPLAGERSGGANKASANDYVVRLSYQF